MISEERTTNLNIISIRRDLVKVEDEHSMMFKFIFYSAIITTLFLISYLRPPMFYKKFMSKFFNLSFKWRGAYWKIYNMVFIILFLQMFLLLVLKVHSDEFSPSFRRNESSEKKLYRLKHKWLVEAEIWLLSLIIIEIITIYRLNTLFDRRREMEGVIEVAEKEKKLGFKEESQNNFPTKETISEECLEADEFNMEVLPQKKEEK